MLLKSWANPFLPTKLLTESFKLLEENLITLPLFRNRAHTKNHTSSEVKVSSIQQKGADLKWSNWVASSEECLSNRQIALHAAKRHESSTHLAPSHWPHTMAMAMDHVLVPWLQQAKQILESWQVLENTIYPVPELFSWITDGRRFKLIETPPTTPTTTNFEGWPMTLWWIAVILTQASHQTMNKSRCDPLLLGFPNNTPFGGDAASPTCNGWYPWFREQCDSWKFYQNVYVYVYVYIYVYIYIHIYIYIYRHTPHMYTYVYFVLFIYVFV